MHGYTFCVQHIGAACFIRAASDAISSTSLKSSHIRHDITV